MWKEADQLLEQLEDENQSLPPVVLPTPSPETYKLHFDDSDNSDKLVKLKVESLAKGMGREPLTNGTTPPPDPALNGSRIGKIVELSFLRYSNLTRLLILR
jgi:hypothetical protein